MVSTAIIVFGCLAIALLIGIMVTMIIILVTNSGNEPTSQDSAEEVIIDSEPAVRTSSVVYMEAVATAFHPDVKSSDGYSYSEGDVILVTGDNMGIYAFIGDQLRPHSLSEDDRAVFLFIMHGEQYKNNIYLYDKAHGVLQRVLSANASTIDRITPGTIPIYNDDGDIEFVPFVLDNLVDVEAPLPEDNDGNSVLVYDGTSWVPGSSDPTGMGADIPNFIDLVDPETSVTIDGGEIKSYIVPSHIHFDIDMYLPLITDGMMNSMIYIIKDNDAGTSLRIHAHQDNDIEGMETINLAAKGESMTVHSVPELGKWRLVF